MDSKDTSLAPEERIILETHDDIAVLRLGSPEEKVITLTKKRLRSFSAALKDINESKELKGLIIIGAYPKHYCAGADISDIRNVDNTSTGSQFSERGQGVFNALANLSIPTVAAIMGSCVGGGLEMAMACDYRLLVDGFGTRVGLPEVKLGIIPGFGGTQRLPRIVGLPNALGLMLKGRLIQAREAFEIGLAEELIVDMTTIEAAYIALEERAKKIVRNPSSLSKRPISIKDRFLTYTTIGRSLIVPKAKEQIYKDTHGHYPAPLQLLETSLLGLKNGLSEGLKAESETIGKLLVSPQSKSLLHVHSLTEQSTQLGKSGKSELADIKLGIVGGGVMGAGIAAACVASGMPVVLIENNKSLHNKIKEKVQATLDSKRSLTKRQREQCFASFAVSSEIEQLKDSSFVIEAVYEDFDIKREVLSRVVELVDDTTIIATNTFSLPVSLLAEGLKCPERLIGMHFFNPAEKMPLVEIVTSNTVSNRAIALTAALSTMLAKYPVVIADVPGFLVNRILSPYFIEAAFLLGDGVSPDEIDKQALVFGMPMGPVRLLDEIGLDVSAKVASIMHESYGPRMEGPLYAVDLVNAGCLGRKSGEGFYSYREDDWFSNPRLGDILNINFSCKKVSAQDIQDRLFLSMVNEAVRCLDERVAGEVGKDAAGQIDLASVMGTGFAPFRGGILHFADTLGASELMRRLMELMEQHGERFAPTKGIRVRAEKEISFYDPV